VISNRLPIESPRPVVAFAVVRVALAAAALVALAATAFPYDSRLAAVVAGIALPWGVAVLVLARRRPELAAGPLVAVGDLAVLVLVGAVAPEMYGPVRFAALFLISVHAELLGERLGVALAVGGAAALVTVGALTDPPLSGRLQVVYDSVFAVAAVSAAVITSRLRASESIGRLRAREATRREMEAEAKVRRDLAESLHDGPVQELVSIDLMLAAAEQAAAKGDSARWRDAVREARAITERNVQALRDEIVNLGPIAFDELSLDVAIEQCAQVWMRRWGLDVKLELERLDLSNDLCGNLFGIAQEAVSNAGRHSGGSRVDVALRARGGVVELTVADNGSGFRDGAPLGSVEPGHIGLARMRERAELIGGRLDIESGEAGTVVSVRAPLVERRAG
jgi:signal transduction histidine kinase